MLGSGGRVVGPGGGLATPSNVSPLGGPVAGEASLLTLHPADEVVRPPRVLRREGDAEEDCWVTLYGYGTTSLFFLPFSRRPYGKSVPATDCRQLYMHALSAVRLQGERWICLNAHTRVPTRRGAWCRFGPDDTNVVLREFEKCGRILRHQFGPGGSNWMHVLFAVRGGGLIRHAIYSCDFSSSVSSLIMIGPLLLSLVHSMGSTAMAGHSESVHFPPSY